MKWLRLVFAFLLFNVFFGSQLFAQYLYHRSITINPNSTAVPNTDQTSFPVLISGTYSYLATVANGGNVENANGYDIIFTSDEIGTTKLDHEIDTYNPTTGAVNFWVRIPTLSHTAPTVIYMQYGDKSITTSQENIPGVWQNDFLSVYHLGNGTTPSYNDSGSSAYNLLLSGAVPAVAGKVGGGVSFDGNGGDYLYFDSVTTYPSGQSPVTLEAWVQASAAVNSVLTNEAVGYGSNSSNGDRAGLWGTGDGGTYLEFENFGVEGNYPEDGNWHQLVGVYEGGTSANLYLDGALLVSSTTLDPVNIVTDELRMGGVPTSSCCAFSGSVDEVRISSGTRSADWVATEFNNQSSPATFYTVSAQEKGCQNQYSFFYGDERYRNFFLDRHYFGTANREFCGCSGGWWGWGGWGWGW